MVAMSSLAKLRRRVWLHQQWIQLGAKLETLAHEMQMELEKEGGEMLLTNPKDTKRRAKKAHRNKIKQASFQAAKNVTKPNSLVALWLKRQSVK
jgi:hypothetical protein